MSDIERRLDAIFAELLRMSDADLRLMRLSWDEVPSEDREAAWQVVRGVVRREPKDKLMDLARSRLAEWVNNTASWTGFGFAAVPTGLDSGTNIADVRRAVLPAMLDAAAAIIAEDELTPEQRAALLGPWSSVAPLETI